MHRSRSVLSLSLSYAALDLPMLHQCNAPRNTTRPASLKALSERHGSRLENGNRRHRHELHRKRTVNADTSKYFQGDLSDRGGIIGRNLFILAKTARALLDVAPPAADLQQQPDVGPDTPRVLPCRCPRCGARMILIECSRAAASPSSSLLLPIEPSSKNFGGLAGISSARRLRPQIFVLKQTTLSIRKSASPVAKRRNECAKYP